MGYHVYTDKGVSEWSQGLAEAYLASLWGIRREAGAYDMDMHEHLTWLQ